jgi:hypothetical protein
MHRWQNGFASSHLTRLALSGAGQQNIASIQIEVCTNLQVRQPVLDFGPGFLCRAGRCNKGFEGCAWLNPGGPDSLASSMCF